MKRKLMLLAIIVGLFVSSATIGMAGFITDDLDFGQQPPGQAYYSHPDFGNDILKLEVHFDDGGPIDENCETGNCKPEPYDYIINPSNGQKIGQFSTFRLQRYTGNQWKTQKVMSHSFSDCSTGNSACLERVMELNDGTMMTVEYLLLDNSDGVKFTIDITPGSQNTEYRLKYDLKSLVKISEDDKQITMDKFFYDWSDITGYSTTSSSSEDGKIFTQITNLGVLQKGVTITIDPQIGSTDTYDTDFQYGGSLMQKVDDDIYVLLENNTYVKMFKSTDDGDTWNEVDAIAGVGTDYRLTLGKSATKLQVLSGDDAEWHYVLFNPSTDTFGSWYNYSYTGGSTMRGVSPLYYLSNIDGSNNAICWGAVESATADTRNAYCLYQPLTPPTPGNSIIYDESGEDHDCDSDWNTTGGHGCDKTYDGSWSTYGDSDGDQAQIDFNYTKPEYDPYQTVDRATSPLQFKNGLGTYNVTIPSSCWNYYDDNIEFRVQVQDSTYDYFRMYCNDGSWTEIWNTYGSNVTRSTTTTPDEYATAGSAWTNPGNIYDDDWNTYGRPSVSGESIFYANYTKPSGSYGYPDTLWEVKDDEGRTNLTMRADCWSAYSDKVMMRVRGRYGWPTDYVYWECYDGGTWEIMRSATTGTSTAYVYEESMHFAIGTDEFYESAMFWNQTNNSLPSETFGNLKQGSPLTLASGGDFQVFNVYESGGIDYGMLCSYDTSSNVDCRGYDLRDMSTDADYNDICGGGNGSVTFSLLELPNGNLKYFSGLNPIRSCDFTSSTETWDTSWTRQSNNTAMDSMGWYGVVLDADDNCMMFGFDSGPDDIYYKYTSDSNCDFEPELPEFNIGSYLDELPAIYQYYKTYSFPNPDMFGRLLYLGQSSSALFYNDFPEPYGLFVNVNDEETDDIIYDFNIQVYNDTKTDTDTGVDNYYNTFSGFTTVKISKSGYYTRYYYLNLTEDNTPYYLNGYLLNATDGQIVTFVVVNQFNDNIEGAQLTAERRIGGVWTLVEEKITDASGAASMFLDPDVQYRITANADGYATFQETLIPTETEYTIVLTGGEWQQWKGYFDEIGLFKIEPQRESWLLNSTISNVLTIEAKTGVLEWWYMDIVWYNGTTLYSNNSTVTTGGVMNFTNTYSEPGNYTMNVMFKRYDYDDPYQTSRLYTISNVTLGNYTLQDTIEGITSLSGQEKSWALYVFVIFIAVCIGAMLAKFSGTGAALAVISWLGFATFLGWFDFIIFLMTLIAVGAVLFIGWRGAG